LYVRGEVFFFKKDFEALNRRQSESGERIYQTARNTAAGTLRQLDPSITASRALTFYVYNILAADGAVPGSLPTTQWETLQYLQALGFPTAPESLFCKDLEDVVAAYKQWEAGRDAL